MLNSNVHCFAICILSLLHLTVYVIIYKQFLFIQNNASEESSIDNNYIDYLIFIMYWFSEHLHHGSHITR